MHVHFLSLCCCTFFLHNKGFTFLLCCSCFLCNLWFFVLYFCFLTDFPLYAHTWNACTFLVPLLLYIFACTVKVWLFFSVVHVLFVTYGCLFCVFSFLLIFPVCFIFLSDFCAYKVIHSLFVYRIDAFPLTRWLKKKHT